jgi:cytosine/adenosine deaminase-related metal-dependent hydrolase
MTVFEADWVCPVSSPPIADGAVSVHNGRIVSVGQASRNSDRVHFPGCAIIPGFVNAHAHLELTVLRGFLEDMEFITWIRTVTASKQKRLTREEMLTSARLGVIESLAAGVTCVGEVMDLGTSWQAMHEFGLQGIAYQELFGPADMHTEESMKGLQQKIEAMAAQQTETQRLGVSPHAPFTVAPRLFRVVKAYAKSEGLPVTIHIAESADEDRYVRLGEGPFADRNRERDFEVEVAGCSPVAHLERCDALDPQTLLIHVIRTEDDDLEILQRTGAGVVHCPKSNAKLGHGIAKIVEMSRRGLRISLGTDSVASNNVVDMFEEMREAIFMQRARTGQFDALDAHFAFRMATLGGAECLGLSDHLGSLEAGKRADFAVVDLNDPALQPVYDPIQAMVYSACRKNVTATYIAGQRVSIEPEPIVKEAHAIARKLAIRDN